MEYKKRAQEWFTRALKEEKDDFDGLIEFIIRARNNLFHGDKVHNWSSIGNHAIRSKRPTVKVI